MCYGSKQKFRWTFFFVAWLFYRFSEVQWDSSNFCEVVSVLGPQKTGTTMLSFIFSKLVVAAQSKDPTKFVATLDQLMLEFSCSRQRRSQNTIFVLESRSLPFRRRKAKFIVLIGKTLRRLKELESEFLHRCSMSHCARS